MYNIHSTHIVSIAKFTDAEMWEQKFCFLDFFHFRSVFSVFEKIGFLIQFAGWMISNLNFELDNR